MSAVGCAMDVGAHPDSRWNNPEPEVVLVVSSRAHRRRDASATTSTCATSRAARRCCSARPRTTTPPARSAPSSGCSTQLRPRRRARLPTCRCRRGHRRLQADRPLLDARISRDPPISSPRPSAHHQYPDGFMLFLGTMFAPVEDRDGPAGLHPPCRRLVTIASPGLGALVNRADRQAGPWTFGTAALMRNLAGRGLL